jgi:hypothetical protein
MVGQIKKLFFAPIAATCLLLNSNCANQTQVIGAAVQSGVPVSTESGSPSSVSSLPGGAGCAPGTSPKPLPVGLLITAPDLPGALVNMGCGNVVVAGNVAVNSSSNMAGIISGSGSVTAPQINFVGNYVESGSGKFVNAQSGTPSVPDFLANVPAPDISGVSVQSSHLLTIKSGSVQLSPGIYQGGIQISGSAVVTMAAGMYVFENGGLSLEGNSSLSGSGVLLYHVNTSPIATSQAGMCDSDNNQYGPSGIDQFVFSGTGSVSLSAASSGAYQGIVFFDRSSISFITLLGCANVSFSGTFYDPNGRLLSAGDVKLTGSSAFIVRRMVALGDSELSIGSASEMRMPVCQ